MCDVGAHFCAVTTFMGKPETCDARCETGAIDGCHNDDGCCDASCSAATDNDCSATCGNGQVDARETCDGNCPTTCTSDDGNACTTFRDGRSSDAMLAQCLTRKITRCANGDGCCPTGCHGGNDGDCQIRCGNDIPEGEEECDDGNATTAAWT